MCYLCLVVMSHGHDLKIVSADGKLLDYYKDILRFYCKQSIRVFISFFQDSLITTATL